MKELPFEEAVMQLETIIEQLSDEKTDLQQLFILYEKGNLLVKLCEKHINSAQIRLTEYKVCGDKYDV